MFDEGVFPRSITQMIHGMPMLCLPLSNQESTAGKKKSKNKNKKKKASRKASFKVNRHPVGIKSGKPLPNPDVDENMMYKGTYSLEKIPVEAHPDKSKVNAGLHSYTLSCEGGGRIEVLLRHNAFFVKQLTFTAPGPAGQVSFLKMGGVKEAWHEAKRRAGFPM